VAGVNGIKTGYTRASGFNLATSVERDNRMVVGVVLGGETGRERDNRMAGLMEKYVPQASRGPMVASIVPGGPRLQTQMPKVKMASAAVLPIPRTRPTPADAASADVAVPMPTPAPDNATAANVPMPNPAPQATASIAAASATDSTTGLPINDQTTVASLIGANSPLALEAVDAPQAQTPAAQAADAQADNSPTAVADATPASDDSATEEGDTGGNDESVDAKPVSAHSGWRIQIAAADTQAGAEEMLDRALAKAGKVLAHASPYTESFSTGSATVYRARFAGFTSKEAARAACTYLVKHKFACLAVGSD
jgi:D-alanyl-D-alanine carboxypeptidase